MAHEGGGEHTGGAQDFHLGPIVITSGHGGHEIGGAHPHWQVGPFVVNSDTMIFTWITMVAVILLGFIAGRAARKKERIPRGFRNLLELIFENLGVQFEQALGAKASRFAPLLITLFLYLMIANWVGLIPGMKSPTSDLNVTFGLAVMVMGIVHLSGMVDKGVFKYLNHFLQPHWAMLPLNLVEEVAKPTTLAFRLFGNILAGEILIVILLILVPAWLPFINSAWLGVSIFVGVIQAFIFTMLSMSYISNAVKDEHHD
ncbi:MAG TPA: ATP synthase F0 subunit A [Firmicutes bacterium]|nr:ATP synthase F0 subunit A [Bacillota bacterium]